MREDLTHWLRQLEHRLRALERTQLLAHLSPGLAPAKTRAALEGLGLPGLPEVEELYAWHNGCWWEDDLTLGQMWLLPLYVFPPLETTVSICKELASSEYWDSGLFPVLDDDSGDYWLVSCYQESFGQVFYDDHELPDGPVLAFGSLRDMVRTAVAAYDEGAFHLDANGIPHEDYAKFNRLAARLNPGISWWLERE